MIINDKDATARLNSPLNLINKLHERKHHHSAMDVFTGNGNKAKSFLQTNTPAIKSEEPTTKSFNPFEKKTDIPQSQQPPDSPRHWLHRPLRPGSQPR